MRGSANGHIFKTGDRGTSLLSTSISAVLILVAGLWTIDTAMHQLIRLRADAAGNKAVSIAATAPDLQAGTTKAEESLKRQLGASGNDFVAHWESDGTDVVLHLVFRNDFKISVLPTPNGSRSWSRVFRHRRETWR